MQAAGPAGETEEPRRVSGAPADDRRGTTAAKRLRADGRTVAIVERDKAGGDCPHRACVPTKALLRSAQVYSLLRRAGAFGLRAGAVGFDWAQVMGRKEDIVRQTGAAG